MALNYTISYTFSPGTTISSSQVNTNFSDNANTWTGLEAKTKSFAALQVDATPSLAGDVVRKDYVDRYSIWRRPVLQYSTATVVNLEAGIDGTSGEARILFPDGSVRTDSTSSHINLTLSRNAVLSGSAQSGFRSGSISANSWFCVYAVKVTDSSTDFVTVADTVTPVQANYTTLNSNFGTNGWVYLGTLPYGDNSAVTTSVPKFIMAGNKVGFANGATMSGTTSVGVLIASTAGAASLTYSYASGTTLSSSQIPSHLSMIDYIVVSGGSTTTMTVQTSGGVVIQNLTLPSASQSVRVYGISAAEGLKNTASGSVAQTIGITGYVDNVLGVGSNPLL